MEDGRNYFPTEVRGQTGDKDKRGNSEARERKGKGEKRNRSEWTLIRTLPVKLGKRITARYKGLQLHRRGKNVSKKKRENVTG